MKQKKIDVAPDGTPMISSSPIDSLKPVNYDKSYGFGITFGSSPIPPGNKVSIDISSDADANNTYQMYSYANGLIEV